MKAIILFFALINLSIYAQIGNIEIGRDVFANSGGSMQKNHINLLLNWTLGEMITGGQWSEDQNIYVTEGFQQSILEEISLVDTLLNSTGALNDLSDIRVYPNPVGDILHIQIENAISENLGFVIYDLDGRNLKSFTTSEHSITCDMSHFSSGVYLLTIYEDGIAIKSFKIIK